MGILLAIPIILLRQIDITLPFIHIDDLTVKVLSLVRIEMPFTPPVGAALGTILLLGVAYWLYRTARGRQRKAESKNAKLKKSYSIA